MRLALCLASLLAVPTLAACGGGGGGAPPFVAPTFNASNFVLGIDNPWFPLVPGTVFTYEKVTDEGTQQTVIEVTDQTRVILGVTCVVVHAVETLDGELVEDTFDWFAQDAQGNVWYLGEDSTEYENGMPVSTQGSWEAGVDGAVAGVIMLAQPVVGATYAQEDAPGVAEDMATVAAFGQSVDVPYGLFPACLRTTDFTPLEPGIAEQKYYAQGVGLLLEVSDEGERNELVSVTPP